MVGDSQCLESLKQCPPRLQVLDSFRFSFSFPFTLGPGLAYRKLILHYPRRGFIQLAVLRRR